MKELKFINRSSEKEYNELPLNITDIFDTDLRAMRQGVKPFSAITYLTSIGSGVVELKISGRPAFRCVYIAKHENTIFVLHSFVKTTNGVDKKAMKTLKARYKLLLSQL